MAQNFSERDLKLSFAILKHLKSHLDSGKLNEDQAGSLEGQLKIVIFKISDERNEPLKVGVEKKIGGCNRYISNLYTAIKRLGVAVARLQAPYLSFSSAAITDNVLIVMLLILFEVFLRIDSCADVSQVCV